MNTQASSGEVIEPFRIDVDDSVLADLHSRLERTRLPDQAEDLALVDAQVDVADGLDGRAGELNVGGEVGDLQGRGQGDFS